MGQLRDFVAIGHWGFLETPPASRKVKVLNFSGGRQSSAEAEMILQGDLPPVDLVLTADPGMENSESYAHVARYQKRFRAKGIEAVTVDGPNLYNDLVQLGSSGKQRLDNPPYWTFRGEGKKPGRLQQKCTRFYKIQPMDRFLRLWMEENLGIKRNNARLGHNVVEKWIGFSADETSRIDCPRQKYVYFRYPLVELGMTKADCIDYLVSKGQPVPPPSVCVACFSNRPSDYVRMAKERPEDFAKAVAVDEAIRDLSQIGVNDPAFVSGTCRPLKELADGNVSDDEDAGSCDAGYCFI